MRWHIMLLLTITAFITAAGFTYHFQDNGIQSAIVKEKIILQKKFSFRCSPLFDPAEADAIPALTGWGNYSWKITTTSDSAQFYFDQGINMYYAFHIIESRASFDKATRFDPACAMAYWGKALAFGPNINDFGYQRPSEAYPSAQKAIELKAGCSKVEQALINAMAVRYTADTTKNQNELNGLYKNAMARVFETYKTNADISALYADALMILHPWDLYNHNYSSKAWTPEIVKVLKHTLTLNPKHPGANHYYIHAMEASSKPGEALRSADFLSKAMPEVSHITHMPSHIYIRTGYYNKGIEQNEKAVNGYQKYTQHFSPVAEGIALYALHNLHMKMNCAQMAGNYEQSIDAAKQLQKEIPAFYLSVPGPLGDYVQYIYQSPLFTQIRFGKWDDILKEPVVDSLAYTKVLQQFARGIAFAKTNNGAKAAEELKKLKVSMNAPSLKEPFTPFNAAYDAAVIAENILAGTIAEQHSDYKTAIAFLQKAVQAEDHLIYNEPRDWLLPARQYLGNVFLKAGKYDEAIAVFKADLAVNPNNGWSLTGLTMAYKNLGKTPSLAAAQRRLKSAWLIKDVQIRRPVF